MKSAYLAIHVLPDWNQNVRLKYTQPWSREFILLGYMLLGDTKMKMTIFNIHVFVLRYDEFVNERHEITSNEIIQTLDERKESVFTL